MHQNAEPIHPFQDTSYDPAIRIIEYDPSWEETFEREAAVIRGTLGSGAVRVDHVGSTSVLGLLAKPIIDINVSVPDTMAVDSYRRPLEGIGYLFVPVPESPDFHFFGKPATRPRTYHIHVCAVGSLHERRQIAVRGLPAYPFGGSVQVWRLQASYRRASSRRSSSDISPRRTHTWRHWRGGL